MRSEHQAVLRYFTDLNRHKEGTEAPSCERSTGERCVTQVPDQAVDRL